MGSEMCIRDRFEDMGGDCKVNGVPYAYVDGTCQVDMPVGSMYVEVVRGLNMSLCAGSSRSNRASVT